MWLFPSFEYTAVNDDEHPSLKRQGRSIVSFIATSILSFIVGLGVSTSLRSTCVETPHELSWTSFTPKTQWLEFQGRLMQKSPYRGMPSQSIDDAWGRYTFNEHFDGAAVVLKVTDEDVRASRKGEWMNSTARMDGQHLATLEIFHQLHCLDVLRKFSFGTDYYPLSTFRSGRNVRPHIDHCIEMIRQTLMCHADTGLVLLHWTENSTAATPDFSTWHKCRDPEDVLEWATERQVVLNETINRPENVVEMPRELLF